MMTVKEISEVTGISKRTLHYYDEIDILRPTRRKKSGSIYTGIMLVHYYNWNACRSGKRRTRPDTGRRSKAFTEDRREGKTENSNYG